MSEHLKRINYKPVFSNGYVQSCCGGIVPLAISAAKFEDLEDMIDSANLSLEYAMRENHHATDSGVETEQAQNAARYFHLRHAILDYNACYDYCLQIIYFAFEFCGDVTPYDETRYDKILRDCVYRIPKKESKPTPFYRNLDLLCISEPLATQLKSELEIFISNREQLAQWANAIKHRGGVSLKGLERSRIDIGVGGKFSYTRHSDGTIDMKFFQDEIFALKQYTDPIELNLSDTICELIHQNKLICEFAEWLFSFVGFSKIQTSNLHLFDDIRPFHFEN